MPAFKLLMVFLFLCFVSNFLGFTTAADLNYLAHFCPNTTTFTRNSTFQSNLNLFLSSLPTNASRSNGFSRGFYNATAGQTSDSESTASSSAVAISEARPAKTVSLLPPRMKKWSLIINNYRHCCSNCCHCSAFYCRLFVTGREVSSPCAISWVSRLRSVTLCFLRRRAEKKYHAVLEQNADNDITTLESLQFDFETIEVAANKFSSDNKLGRGGFGEVYKGVLSHGQEIAVKSLSRSSGQGAQEFKNEVVLVAKLQHRNLVRLRGFCLEGDEKILVYEFVPNKSLDYFLYDPEKQGQLDWSRRYKIIGGIARGILYLHEDSQLIIIHHDLKASNILLDAQMNPKISDFGLARIFGVDQTQGNTSRIVGTYGYMSPEYAMHGKFSVKSDVYSFGVLALETITGKKNSSFYQTDGAEDLLSYAWKHWRDGTPLQLLDSNLTDSYSRDEVTRCIHVGLLCVQEDPADRPSMATIVLALNSYSVTLPVPRQPALFISSRTERSFPEREFECSDKSTSKSMPWSVDEASITEVYPR